MSQYPHVFTPVRLGPLTLANRVVFSAHLTNFAVDGRATAQHAAYYGARAAGGAGLVITEELSVHPDDRPYEKLVHRPEGLSAIADAVHVHEVPLLAQLNHSGGQSSGCYSATPVRAASPVPDPMFGEVPHELTTADIAELVRCFARAAKGVRAAGLDGVELQASHAGLLRGFLSPATNTRTDGYGRDRTRLLREVIDAVRTAWPEGELGVRLGVDELLVDGITGCEAEATVARLGEGVDHVTVSVGLATSSLHAVIPSMHTPHGYAHDRTRRLHDAAGVPVIGVGAFTTPEQMEAALADGVCDLVGVVRGQVADPELVTKARAGRAVDIRGCMGCNQACVGRTGRNLPLRCVVNPRAGLEAVALPTPGPRRRVLVVGGGPAGLQAAAAAAGRGHTVTLVEAGDSLGGRLALAATAPGRERLAGLTRHLERECRRAGVTVRLGERLDADGVRAHAADVVVLATGALPAPPAWADGRVVDATDVLSGRARPAGRVLVVDELGTQHATSTAELLAQRGCIVTTITAAMVAAQHLSTTLDLPGWRRRASDLGIVERTDLVVGGCLDGMVTLLHHPTGVSRTQAFDAVVHCATPVPDERLWRELSGDADVHRVGDCLAARDAHAATTEGHRVGSTI